MPAAGDVRRRTGRSAGPCSWWTLRSVVSMTTSASALTGSSSSRSRAMASSTRLRPVAQRVAAPGAVVAADQLGVRRLEEQDPHPVAAGPQAARPTSRMSAWCGPLPTTRASRSIGAPGHAGQLGDLRDRATGGRLSTTNQPRSSRLSAACERPAPDSPVITRMSRHPLGCSGHPTADGETFRRSSRAAEEQQPRDRGGRRRTRAARARKPGGGAGSSMPLDAGGRGAAMRVDVAAERPVDERDEHALLDLLDRSRPRPGRARCASTARAGRGSGRRSSRCSASAAAGGSGRTGTGRRARRTRATSAMASSTSRMCSNTRQATTASKAAVGERQRVGPGPGVGRAAAPLARPPRSGSTVGSTPTTASAPIGGGQPGHLALAAADVEHAARPRPGRSAASGRICSSYSGSAPSVNPSCHQPAWVSHEVGRSPAVARSARRGWWILS